MRSIVLEGEKGSIGFGNLQNLWVKRQRTQRHTVVPGRGVWESNPPGTAPSDPPAVLKTVRPTGAPTPPRLVVRGCIVPPAPQIVKPHPENTPAPHPPPPATSPSAPPRANQASHDRPPPQYSAYQQHEQPAHPPPHPQ